MIQGFDNLNLIKRRSIPYDEYFGVMELTKAQKARRKDLAFILEDAIAIWLLFMRNNFESGVLNEMVVKQELTNSIYDIIDDGDYFTNENERVKYISNFVEETYRSTVENMAKYPDDVVPKEGVSEDEVLQDVEETGTIPTDKTEPYWTSTDRAEFIAENESNTIINNSEFTEAARSGKTHKIWMSYGDDRVRLTHQIVDGAKIPIDAYFDVGRARMLYPKDVTSELSTGAECPEETISCRCVCKYV